MAHTGHASSTSAELSIVLPSSVRCRYKNMFCNSHRATKANGELHTLCEEHRVKANQNQKRLRDNRRHRNQSQSQSVLAQAQASASAVDEGGEGPYSSVEMEFEPLHPNAHGSLSPSDWQELVELWADEEGADALTAN